MANLQDLLNSPSKQVFSTNELEEIFFGAIIGGIVEADEFTHVKREFFSFPNTLQLFDVVEKCIAENTYIDFIWIINKLSTAIGSNEAKSYIDKIVGKVPQELVLSSIIETLENNYIRRETSKLLEKARSNIQNSPQNTIEFISQLNEAIEKLTQYNIDYSFEREIEKTIEDLSSPDPPPVLIPTGLKAIDDIIGGLSYKEVTMIAGRPGHGKTTMSVALALSILNKNPEAKVVKFELEMSKDAINRKMISSVSKVSSYKMRINNLTTEEIERVNLSKRNLTQYHNRLFIYDNVYDLPTMKKICKKIGATVCMVDFITLMDGIDEDKRNDLGRMVKATKRFTKANNMAWVYFAQLGRGVEARETKRPQSSDLAESDQLSQLASEILLLMYEYKYTNNPKHQNILFLIFDKTRYSGIGEKRIHFNPDLAYVEDLP